MSQTKPNLTSLQRHKDYYLPGGDLYFLVENYHFRVHRYFFERESRYFKDKLAVPANPGAQPQGTSDSNAFVLSDIKAADFERFLWVFYNPKYSLYDSTLADWSVILDLADKWSFPEVKALAVREFEKMNMSDVDRIALYHRYHIEDTLLVPRYASLCSRDQTLTPDEGRKLGIDTAMALARARECARSKPAQSGGLSPLPTDFTPQDMQSLITDVFSLSKPQPNGSNAAGSEKPQGAQNGANAGGGKQVNGMVRKGSKGGDK